MRFLSPLALMLVALALLPACAQTDATRATTVQDNFVYVTNQGSGSVTVINARTHEVETTVDLGPFGFDVNSKPHDVAVEPDGSHWYVSVIGANRVLKFTRDNELVGQSEFEVAGLVKLDASSNKLYVGRSMGAVNPPRRIGMIDRNTMEIEELDVFVPRPHALAVSPDGGHVFVASMDEDRLVTIDMASGDLAFTDIDGGQMHNHMFMDMSISPVDGTLLSPGQMSGRMFFFNTDADGAFELPIAEQFDVGEDPWHSVFSKDGQYAYVARKKTNSVIEIDVAAREVTRTVEGEGFNEPHAVAMDPAGRYIFVSNNNLDQSRPSTTNPDAFPGTVTVIDLESFEVVKVIEVGNYATGINAR